MELRKPFNISRFLIISFAVVFGVYLWFGLQPVVAVNSNDSWLDIPALDIHSSVAETATNDGGIVVPDTIAGKYVRNDNKTLIIGHSTTVFQNLRNVAMNDEIIYDGNTYRITSIETVLKNNINMYEILSEEERDTIIIMTCAGELYDNGDASHRLIVRATV